jgi:hypothetical protein
MGGGYQVHSSHNTTAVSQLEFSSLREALESIDDESQQYYP